MRQQPISVHVKSTKSTSYRTLRSKLDTRTSKMSGTTHESETNLELLSKDDEIVDKKGSTNSVIWEWLKVTRRRLKRSVKYVVGL